MSSRLSWYGTSTVSTCTPLNASTRSAETHQWEIGIENSFGRDAMAPRTRRFVKRYRWGPRGRAARQRGQWRPTGVEGVQGDLTGRRPALRESRDGAPLWPARADV